ncbi:MAG TPA: hypothetical protein DD668_00680, partial [Alphaproteobacteria bacterium]|nr:hypothetical protein [Alphaproteobacteria bacterium]
MQLHGRLTEEGTTRIVEATLLVEEASQDRNVLLLARAGSPDLQPVTINHVLPMVGGGDLRLRLSTGEVMRFAANTDNAPPGRVFPKNAR